MAVLIIVDVCFSSLPFWYIINFMGHVGALAYL